MEQIVDCPVAHVFERIMKGIVCVAVVVLQECLQRFLGETGDVSISQMSNVMTEILEQIKEMFVKNMNIRMKPISERTRKQVVRRIMDEIIEAVNEVYSAGDPRNSTNLGHDVGGAARPRAHDDQSECLQGVQKRARLERCPV